MSRPRLAVLVSGGGTTLQNLLDRTADGRLDADVRLVVGSKLGLGAEPRALAAGVPYQVVDRRSYVDAASFGRRVLALLDPAEIDLVCCAGWVHLIPVPDVWRGRVLNVHPSLLPAFGGKGMYGTHVHRAVLAHGCKVSGCTVHLVDDQYDTGPILVQRAVEVRADDTPDTLAARVMEAEREAYPEAIARVSGPLSRYSGRGLG